MRAAGHRERRTWILAAAVAATMLAACGSDTNKPSDEPIAGTSGQGTLCGAMICGAGQVCTAQLTCMAVCMDDTTCNGGKCCGGVCVQAATDPLNCGACGTACTQDQACSAGVCTGLVCQGTLPAPVPNEDDAGTAGGAGSGATLGANGCPPNETCARSAAGTPTCMCGASATCPAGESCSASGSCSCSGGSGCTSPQTCCGSGCADLSSDTSNCGSCGKSCGLGQACVNGSCGCAGSGETDCDGTCTSLMSDAMHCGACDTACPTGASCKSGACECPDGQIACGGACVDASKSPNCGACDVTCGGPTTCGERVTDSGTFECLCPNYAHIRCGDVCVDPSKSPNCGACDVTCGGPTSCKDPNTTDTTLEYDCLCPAAGETLCDTTCVNLQTDANNCGECGLACLNGETCTDGVCSCPMSGDIYCDTNGATAGGYQCIDEVDDNNCFGCGVQCLGNARCDATAQGCKCFVSGTNTPDTGKGFCNGSCIDITMDEANCGGCDIACPTSPASTCTAGKCSCPANQLWCADGAAFKCLDIKSDENNCGACGMKCGAGQECCNGACLDPTMDYDTNTNCGACGTKCGSTGCGFLGLGACNCTAGSGTYSCK